MKKKIIRNLIKEIRRVVLYIRVSTDEQAKHGYSVDNQTFECTKFAENRGYTVVKTFVDDGVSAKDLNRHEIQNLMKFCRQSKNHIDAVIVWRLDRISRNNKDYHGVLKPLFDERDIHLLSATEANVDTIEGDLMRNIGMSFAEYERKLIGVRTVAAMRRKAEIGEYPHKAPLGYKNITTKIDKKKKIIIDKDRAFYVKRAFNLYDTGMYSLRSLTKKLYEEGFRNAKGNRIAKSCIERMLKNIFYTGVFEYEGTIRENAQHPAIISKDLFYRVQDRLIDPNKIRKHDVEFAYTGLITCGQCGCQLTAELKRNRQGEPKYIYYHCTGNRGGDCMSDYTTEDAIDTVVTNVIKQIVIPTEIKNDILKELKLIHEIKNEY